MRLMAYICICIYKYTYNNSEAQITYKQLSIGVLGSRILSIAGS